MYAGSAGTKTATVVYGGSTAPPSGGNRTTATNEYNGSSWTSGGAMPTATMQMANLGTQTAAGSFGGNQPSGNVSTGYEYDGSSWTSGGSIGSAGYNAAGFGILNCWSNSRWIWRQRLCCRFMMDQLGQQKII